MTDFSKMSCPIPLDDYPVVVTGHGGGGKLTHQLISQMFLPLFANEHLTAGHDGAVVETPGRRIAVTTDSHVVTPLFFPGGDIGKLAVYGTVNDLAMCGARPLYLTLSFIIEEGFSMETLWQVCKSIQEAAQRAEVRIITGDTKVIDRSTGNELYINTTGVGVPDHDLVIAPNSIRDGDAIILSGDIGRHGIAIMSSREGLQFESTIESDCAPLWQPVHALLDAGIDIHCLRDLTRGGLASALIEIAGTAGKAITLQEERIPVCREVRAACEILGFDPIHVANEGRFVTILPADAAERAVEILSETSTEPVIIGQVTRDHPGRVLMENAFGGKRIIEMISGEQLPRIC